MRINVIDWGLGASLNPIDRERINGQVEVSGGTAVIQANLAVLKCLQEEFVE